jgi:HEAT repeat protein
MAGQGTYQLSLIVRARQAAALSAALLARLRPQGWYPTVAFRAEDATEAQLRQSAAVVWIVEGACATAFHPDAVLLARVSESVPVLVLVIGEAAPLDATDAITVLHTTPDGHLPEREIDDWAAQHLPQTPGDLRTSAINSAFFGATAPARLAFSDMRTCRLAFDGLLSRAARWIAHVPTQIVEQPYTADGVRLDPVRVSVVDLRELLRLRHRVALVATPDSGRDDLIASLIAETAVAASADPSAPVPVSLPLSDWVRGEPLVDFVRFYAPVLGTSTARDWTVHLFLTDIPRGLTFDTPRLAELTAWIDDDPRFERVTAALPPGTDDAARRLGFTTLHMPPLKASAARAIMDWTLPEHQAEVLWERLEASGQQLPGTPFEVAALTACFRTSNGPTLPETPAVATARWVEAAWNVYSGDVQTWMAVSAGLAGLAYAALRDDLGDYVSYTEAVELAGDEATIEIGLALGWLLRTGDTIHFAYDAFARHFAALGVWWTGVATVLIYPQYDLDGERIPTRWDAVLATLAQIAENAWSVLDGIADVDPVLAHEIAVRAPTLADHRSKLRLRLLRALATDMAHLAPIFDQLSEADRALTLLDGVRATDLKVRRAAMGLISRRIEADPSYYNAAWLGDVRRQLDNRETLPDDTVLALVVGSCQLGAAEARTCVQLLAASDDRARLAAFEWLARRPASPVGTAATEALAEIGTLETVPGLLRALTVAGEALLPIVRNALTPFAPVAQTAFRAYMVTKPDAAALVALLDVLAAAPEANAELILALADHPDADVAIHAIALFVYLKPEAVMARLEKAMNDDRHAQSEGRTVGDVAREVRRMFAGEGRRAKQERRRARPNRRPKAANSTSEVLKARLQKLSSDGEKLAKVRSEDPEERATAVAEVRAADPGDAMPVLSTMIFDADDGVFEEAVKGLAAQDTPDAAVVLIDALSEVEEDRHHRIIEVLRSMGDTVIPALPAAVGHKDVNTRAAAALLLGDLKVHAAMDTLRVALLDRKYAPYHLAYVCDLAADALENLGTQEASEVVAFWQGSLTASGAAKSQTAPQKAATMPPDDAPLAALLEAFPALPWGDRETVAGRVQQVVQRDPSETALDQLLKYQRHEDWVLRWTVAEALGCIEGERAQQALTAMLEDTEWTVRMYALRSLGAQGAPLETFERGLTDAHPSVREAAVLIAGNLPDGKAAKALRGALDDPVGTVRFAAIDAIARQASRRVVPLLLKALSDPRPDVRFVATEALVQVADERSVPFLVMSLEDTGRVGWDKRTVGEVAAEALLAIDTDEAKQALDGAGVG